MSEFSFNKKEKKIVNAFLFNTLKDDRLLRQAVAEQRNSEGDSLVSLSFIRPDQETAKGAALESPSS